MNKLANSVKVFLPLTNKNGVKVDLSSDISAAIKVIDNATAYESRNSNVFQFNIAELSNDIIRVINCLVYAIFTKTDKLTVSIEINGTLHILEDEYFSESYLN